MNNGAISEIITMGFNPDAPYAKDLNNKKAAKDISVCRTKHLGAIKTKCADCGAEHYTFRSCGNRNCPQCQGLKQIIWTEARASEIVDAPYYHAVFTVPSELNGVFLSHQKECYSILFSSVAETLKTLAEDSKHLGAKIGFISILHTWGSNLSYHPHIHVILLGYGLKHGKLVKPKYKDFFFPVKVMSRLFRGKLLSKLKNLEEINSSSDIDYSNLYKKEWVVYLKPTAKNAENAIEYLSRYTYRVAISDSRIINYDNDFVTFSYKDYRDNNKIKVMTLSNKEFVRRYFMHVLPKGFIKIRSYGLICNLLKNKSLTTLRLLLKCRKRENRFKGLTPRKVLEILYPNRYCCCRKCGSVNIVTTRLSPYITERLDTG